jgi:adenylate cyclase class IV
LTEIREAIRIQTGASLSLWPSKFIQKYNITQDLSEKELKVLEVDVGEALQCIYTHSPTLVFHGIVDDARYDFPPGDSQHIIETIRIRKKNDDYYLTIKKKNTSKTIKDRQEFEVSLQKPEHFVETFSAM